MLSLVTSSSSVKTGTTLLLSDICCHYFDIFLFPFFLDSDITALAKDRVYTHINLNEMTIHQVTNVNFSKMYFNLQLLYAS